MSAPSLRDLQALFWSALNGRQEPELAAAVASSSGLAGTDRIAIYAEMYFGRLRDVLAEDFEKTAAALGPERFGKVARAYLAAHPSEHPSVRHVGRNLPGFLESRPLADAPPWLTDMARLEWARVDAFDAPDADPIGVDHLRSLPEAEWPAAPLRSIPALRVVESDWPLHTIWQEGDAPPARTALRVWRQDGAVYHCAMDPLEQAAVERLRAGASFGGICETLADLDPAEAPAEAGALLARWIEDGLIAGIG